MGCSKDKKKPNALRTVLNVINSFNYPVNINDLYYFLNLENSSKTEIKRVLGYSTKSKLLQCVVNHNDINFLEPEQLTQINDIIKNVGINKEIEVELRLGVIKQGIKPRFEPKIMKPFHPLLHLLFTCHFIKVMSLPQERILRHIFKSFIKNLPILVILIDDLGHFLSIKVAVFSLIK